MTNGYESQPIKSDMTAYTGAATDGTNALLTYTTQQVNRLTDQSNIRPDEYSANLTLRNVFSFNQDARIPKGAAENLHEFA